MSDTITKYNLLSDLPSVPEIGENAFVEETSKTYRSQDLSTIISNSFEFSGNNSFLRTNGFTNNFTNANDTWAIEFWSYIISNDQDYPIFSLQKNIDNPSYSFFDVTGTHSLSHTNLKAFNFSPYNAHTSSVRFDNANIKTDNPLTGFNYHDDFSISFWTYPINTSYTLIDFTKTDEDKTTLRLTNNKIVDNGVDIIIDNSHSFGNNDWYHNTLSYDGFDYSLFSNDSSVELTRYVANDIDSNNQLSITDLNINRDVGFKCKISFGSSPSDSTLFEFGEVDRYVKLSVINGGNTLEFRANGTNPLIITTNNFPKDNDTHIVSWDVRISPERIRLWIDDELKGTASTASTIENGVWASGIVQSRSSPVSSFFRRRTSFLQTNPALSYYTFKLQSQSYFWYAPTIVDTGFTINTNNGDNIYYYEFIMTQRNGGANRDMEFYLVDTSQYTLPRYGRAVNFQTTTFAFTSFTSYNHVLRPGDIISVFISEQTKQVSMYKNGTDNLWRGFGFSGLPGTSAYQGWGANYCNNEFRVEHSPSRWIYGPTHYNFLTSSVQNRLYAGSNKVGAYGLSVNNNVGSDSFSGDLRSKLRIYPQTFGSLSLSTFNIGSNYDLNGATSSNYKGYIKDFEVRDTKSLTNTPPTSPISSTASTNFLLNQTTDEQIILDYRSNGSIKVNDRIEFDIGDSNDNNTWLHTALVYDGTNLNVYKDGSLIGQTSNFTLEGNTLSDGEIELGITSDRNINSARYDKSYLNGYIKEFILHDSARYNATFSPLNTNYISGNEILLTATEANVPDDGTTFIKEGTITSESFSPYTSNDLGWIENGAYIKTNRTANIITKSNKDILEIDVDSYAQPQSFLLTLDNRDKENNLINWAIDEWQTAPFTIIKQNNNNILIEPQSIDSYQDEQRLLNLRIVGKLADDSLPSYSQFGIFAHSNVELNFTYRNYSMVSEINSSNILDNTFNINVADATDIANFTSIAPRPFRTVGDMITDFAPDPEYNNGAVIDVTGDGSNFFKREVTTNGVRIMGAGTVGGQTAVPDAWLEKVARMFELFTDPYGTGINGTAQRALIQTLSGDVGTYHAGKPTIQRVARGAGADYSTNFLTDAGIIFWDLTDLFDNTVQNDMVWYLNSTGDGYGDGDTDAQEVIEHVFHTLHMHGLDAQTLKMYPFISSDWASGPLYAAMEEAYDAGKWDPSGYNSPSNSWKTNGDAFEVAAKEYLFLLNFAMFEYTSLWDGGSLSPEWSDDMRTQSGIQSNNPLGYALHNSYIAPVISKPSLTTIRSIFQDGNTPAQDDPNQAGVSGYIVTPPNNIQVFDSPGALP